MNVQLYEEKGISVIGFYDCQVRTKSLFLTYRERWNHCLRGVMHTQVCSAPSTASNHFCFLSVYASMTGRDISSNKEALTKVFPGNRLRATMGLLAISIYSVFY